LSILAGIAIIEINRFFSLILSCSSFMWWVL
jgi:hypothetical protein